jgi:hypothetical protein
MEEYLCFAGFWNSHLGAGAPGEVPSPDSDERSMGSSSHSESPCSPLSRTRKGERGWSRFGLWRGLFLPVHFVRPVTEAITLYVARIIGNVHVRSPKGDQEYFWQVLQ